MHLDDTFRNKPSEELFNNFFMNNFLVHLIITLIFIFQTIKFLISILRGGGSVHAFHFGKTYFELGVGGEGQETSRHFKGSFGSIRAILPM